MKKLFLLLFSLVAFSSFAQVDFRLKSDGNFLTLLGEDYVVVPYEGKSAHEIFNMLKANIAAVFNDASKVTNSVDDTYIKVRGFASHGKIFPYITIMKLSVEGFYDLEFKIKDGRVRVSAPYIEEEATMVGGTAPIAVSYRGMLQKHIFESNGSIKKKRVKDVPKIEAYINGILNSILLEREKIEDDW